MSHENGPAEQAKNAVSVKTRVLGGPWFIELGPSEKPTIRLGPYDNPSVAQQEAKAIVGFLETFIRKCQ